MTESNVPLDLDTMSPAQFEEHLPEFFASGNGRISNDPRYQKFLSSNPTCSALVRDLEYIAETARQLLEPVEDPSPEVWSGIQTRLGLAASEDVD